jgi:ankyrin repeat protein
MRLQRAESVMRRLFVDARIRGVRMSSPLIEAVLRKDLEEVKRLLASGVDRSAKDEHGKRACDIAAMLGYDIILIHLIEGGCGG